MVRIGFTLYLVVSTAVGPSLCCCLPGDLLALCTSSARHRCCGHHAATRRHQQAKTEQPRETPAPAPQKDCPCKAVEPQPAALTPSHPSPASEYTRSSMLPHGASVGVPLLGAAHLTPHSPVQAPGQCITFPFLSSREILRALHILRC
jgi:hypothetical protein